MSAVSQILFENHIQRMNQPRHIEQEPQDDVQYEGAADAGLEPNRQRRQQNRDDHHEQFVCLNIRLLVSLILSQFTKAFIRRSQSKYGSRGPS